MNSLCKRKTQFTNTQCGTHTYSKCKLKYIGNSTANRHSGVTIELPTEMFNFWLSIVEIIYLNINPLSFKLNIL
jgi:hypothetical protein